jgi:hypothetical protein
MDQLCGELLAPANVTTDSKVGACAQAEHMCTQVTKHVHGQVFGDAYTADAMTPEKVACL